MRDEFPQAVINTLSKRAGMLCSNPDCRRPTVGAHDNHDKSTSIGEAAHITAAAPGGPRYDPKLSQEERRSIGNAIWLCSTHARLIDKDPDRFPVVLLQKWKHDVEKESADKLRKTSENPEPIVKPSVKKTLAERAAESKGFREKELARDAFLRTSEALEEARNQVRRIIAKLKESRQTLADPQTGFYLGIIERGEEMYGFGHGEKYVCFNWSRPGEWDIEKAPLVVGLLNRTGTYPFDLKETTTVRRDYKYSRDINGNDGWVDYSTGENFITTDNLVDQWIEDFLRFIGYEY